MKKIDVEKTIMDIIEQEGKEEGIQLIRNIVNRLARGQRKKQIRVNSYDLIANEVYTLIVDDGYSRTRAIDKVETDKGISASTINNHLTKFNAEAKENDYLNFGKTVDEYVEAVYHDYNYHTYRQRSVEYGKEFNFNDSLSSAFYLKYLNDKDKKENRNFKRSTAKYKTPFKDIDVPF